MTSDTLTRVSIDTGNLNTTDRPVYEWLEQHFGAPPVEFYRLLRWRLSWEAVVMVGGQPKAVVIRATRGEGFSPPVPLEVEAQLHNVMEQHGILAPHLYGMIDKPLAIVMSKLPGGINTGLITDESQRWKVRSEYIESLVKLHSIPATAFAEVGIPLPQTPNMGSLEYYQRNIALVRKQMSSRPFPFLEFIDKWLAHFATPHRERVALVTADSGQFMYDKNKFTGLIDFELAYLGDPAAEFAGMRVRDTAEPLGDIGRLRDYYEQLTGDRIDRQLIAYHSAGFAGSSGLLTFPMAYNCETDVDYVAYLQFSICMARWGLQGVFEFMGLEQEPITEPAANSTLPFSGATRHQNALLTTWQAEDPALNYHFEGAAALNTYLERCLVYGQDILAADLSDIQALTGSSVSSRDEADQQLAGWIRGADESQFEAMARFFDRWLQRQSFLLKTCGSQAFVTETRLQSIPQRADDKV